MGTLIVIEGLDGSGKATQTALLAGRLQKASRPTRQVSFPDYKSGSSALVRMYLGGEFGDKPGDVNAYAASSFYAVDRYASYMTSWRTDLENGVVIADRYTTSNGIHQCAKLPREQWDEYLDWLFDYEYRLLGIPCPDLVIYLRVDPDVSQRLLDARYNGNTDMKDIHERDREYLERCRKAADYCAEKLGWTTVECTRGGDMRTIEDIHGEVALIAEAAL